MADGKLVDASARFRMKAERIKRDKRIADCLWDMMLRTEPYSFDKGMGRLRDEIHALFKKYDAKPPSQPPRPSQPVPPESA